MALVCAEAPLPKFADPQRLPLESAERDCPEQRLQETLSTRTFDPVQGCERNQVRFAHVALPAAIAATPPGRLHPIPMILP